MGSGFFTHWVLAPKTAMGPCGEVEPTCGGSGAGATSSTMTSAGPLAMAMPV